MSLRTKIQQIAQETAIAVVGSLLTQQTQGVGQVGFTGTITQMSLDPSGNRIASIQDSNGNFLSNVYITSDRPLGVGDTVSLLNSNLAQ